MKLSDLPVSEAQLQSATAEFFEYHGWCVERMSEDHIVGTPGVPDLHATSPYGLEVWLEMKRPATKRNPEGHVRGSQKSWLSRHRSLNVACCVVAGISDQLDAIAKLARQPHATGDRDRELMLSHVAAMSLCDELMERYSWWPV